MCLFHSSFNDFVLTENRCILSKESDVKEKLNSMQEEIVVVAYFHLQCHNIPKLTN
jgi:hypothetical protein